MGSEAGYWLLILLVLYILSLALPWYSVRIETGTGTYSASITGAGALRYRLSGNTSEIEKFSKTMSVGNIKLFNTVYYWFGEQIANYVFYSYIFLTLSLLAAIMGLKNYKFVKLSLIFFVLAVIAFPSLIAINHSEQALYLAVPGLTIGISWGYIILLLTVIIIVLWSIF